MERERHVASLPDADDTAGQYDERYGGCVWCKEEVGSVLRAASFCLLLQQYYGIDDGQVFFYYNIETGKKCQD